LLTRPKAVAGKRLFRIGNGQSPSSLREETYDRRRKTENPEREKVSDGDGCWGERIGERKKTLPGGS